MIDIAFKVKENFHTSPNYLLDFHRDYNFAYSNYCFGKLSKTNIFIGENNSGKSRFLRYLFANNFSYIDLNKVDTMLKGINKRDIYDPYDSVPNDKFVRFDDLYTRVDKKRNNSFPSLASQFFNNLQEICKTTDNNSKFYFPILRGIKDYKTVIYNKLKKFSDSSHIQNKDAVNHFLSLIQLQDAGLDSLDVYKDIIKEEYFKDSNVQYNILTGGQLYKEIKSMLLGDEEQRNMIDEFQQFLKKTFFEEYDTVQLIPREKDKVLYVKIGDDKEKPIYDWGDGTQQLIIILYSLFKYKNQSGKMFFIEEPEMYLHPGILRKFIEVINSEEFKYHQYFITTHSNIILDTSADADINMSIFKFKKVKDKKNNNGKDFLVEQCNSGDVSLLNELGVRNSSVFLSNCSIWVEGITDRLYLKHYLKLFMNKHKNGEPTLRENIDYTFIEFGGGNLSHLNFDLDVSQADINARFINNKIFLIADNDGTKGGKKHERKQHLKEVLADNFYELDVMEIENLVSQDILKKILISKNPEKESIILEKFNKELKYKHTKLGGYLQNILFKGLDVKTYGVQDSGTIKNKLEFCKDVIASINDFDQLSMEAQNLTMKIYQFITANNA